MKYKFAEETSPTPSPSKKRKMDDYYVNNILNYSQIKLPATAFLKYLNDSSLDFCNECIPKFNY
jgi:hypothetical protein